MFVKRRVWDFDHGRYRLMRAAGTRNLGLMLDLSGAGGAGGATVSLDDSTYASVWWTGTSSMLSSTGIGANLGSSTGGATGACMGGGATTAIAAKD